MKARIELLKKEEDLTAARDLVQKVLHQLYCVFHPIMALV
jgi:hypothetical protein